MTTKAAGATWPSEAELAEIERGIALAEAIDDPRREVTYGALCVNAKVLRRMVAACRALATPALTVPPLSREKVVMLISKHSPYNVENVADALIKALQDGSLR